MFLKVCSWRIFPCPCSSCSSNNNKTKSTKALLECPVSSCLPVFVAFVVIKRACETTRFLSKKKKKKEELIFKKCMETFVRWYIWRQKHKFLNFQQTFYVKTMIWSYLVLFLLIIFIITHIINGQNCFVLTKHDKTQF